jgi:hypothetical protein
MNVLFIKPDMSSFLVLLIRSLGPLAVVFIGIAYIIYKMDFESNEIFLLGVLTCSLWSIFLIIGLLRRFFYKVEIKISNGEIFFTERGLFFRRSKVWKTGSIFEVVNINTLGYLKRIKDEKGFEFGQLLSDSQRLNICRMISNR